MNLLKEPYEMMVHTVATGKKRTQTRYQQVNDRDDWGQRTISHTKSRQEDLDWAVRLFRGEDVIVQLHSARWEVGARTGSITLFLKSKKNRRK